MNAKTPPARPRKVTAAERRAVSLLMAVPESAVTRAMVDQVNRQLRAAR
jgi:hypothetical protein